jgi:hypothetical protein
MTDPARVAHREFPGTGDYVYLAPELLKLEWSKHTKKSDIYSFAMTAFEVRSSHAEDGDR